MGRRIKELEEERTLPKFQPLPHRMHTVGHTVFASTQAQVAQDRRAATTPPRPWPIPSVGVKAAGLTRNTLDVLGRERTKKII
jgi:hypothetical protein